MVDNAALGVRRNDEQRYSWAVAEEIDSLFKRWGLFGNGFVPVTAS